MKYLASWGRTRSFRLPLPNFLTIFIAILSIYLVTATGAFYGTDGVTRDAVAHNLLYRHEIVFTQAENGEIGEIWASPGVDGRLYSIYGIGQSLMEIPFLIIIGILRQIPRINNLIGAHNVPVLMLMSTTSALICALIYELVQVLRYNKQVALVIAILVAFGSILWVLSRQAYDVVQEALGVIGALCLIMRSYQKQQHTNWELFGAGFFFGLALIARVSSIIAAPAIGVLLISHVKSIGMRQTVKAVLWFGLGVASIAWIAPLYNVLRFGSVWAFGYDGHPPYPGGAIIWRALQWLVSPHRGIVIYMPLLIAMPLLLRKFAQKHSGLGVALVVLLISYLLFYSYYTGLGLYGWGPYYLLPALIPLYLVLAPFIDTWIAQQHWKRFAILLLIILSVAVQMTSVSVPMERYFAQVQSEGHLNVDEGNLFYPLQYAPILIQGSATIHNIKHLSQPVRYLDAPTDPSPSGLLLELYEYNLPDWWWLKALYSGGETSLIIPIWATFCLIWLAWCLHSLNQSDVSLTNQTLPNRD